MVGRPGLSILHPAGDLLRAQEGGSGMSCQDMLLGFNSFLKMFSRVRSALIGSVIGIMLMGTVAPEGAPPRRIRDKNHERYYKSSLPRRAPEGALRRKASFIFIESLSGSTSSNNLHQILE